MVYCIFRMINNNVSAELLYNDSQNERVERIVELLNEKGDAFIALPMYDVD